MTTIVGISTSGAGCWLAGDSAVTWGKQIASQKAPKIWRTGQLIVGTSGGSEFESRMRRLELRATRNPEVWGAELEQACMGLEDSEGDEALIGCAGQLWFFGPGAGRPWAAAAPWAAIGSGSLPAAAILRLSARRGVRRALGWDHKRRLTEALEAAEALTTGTRRRFRYLEW